MDIINDAIVYFFDTMFEGVKSIHWLIKFVFPYLPEQATAAISFGLFVYLTLKIFQIGWSWSSKNDNVNDTKILYAVWHMEIAKQKKIDWTSLSTKDTFLVLEAMKTLHKSKV